MPSFKKVQPCLSFWIVALLVAVSGCGARISNDPKKGDDGLNVKGDPNPTINGIIFEMPWQVGVVEAIKAAQQPAGRVTLTKDKHRLDVADGKVNYNGKDYGPVQQGDKVKLTEQGVVSVNGADRKPQDSKR